MPLFDLPAAPPLRDEEPCASCSAPARDGVDIDRNDGRGYVRYPVCDVGCANELMGQLMGGSQLRSIYPSRET